MLTVPARWAGQYIILTVVILGIDRDIVTITMGECKLCRLASGVCTVGMRKIHDRTDPACRLYGVTSAATASPKARSRSPPREQRGGPSVSTAQTSRGESSPTSARPLSELSTRKGVVLLYDPDPLDAWIGRGIGETKEGKYVDTETGKVLSKQEGKKYAAYLKRHESRNETARRADKLFHIVDKYLPLQADETRAFVARFPERVHTLLPKVRKIRNKLRQDGGADPATGEFTSQGDSSGHGWRCPFAAYGGGRPRWGMTSKQTTTQPTTAGRGGNLEDPPTKATVKAFWGRGPMSQRARHEVGEYGFSPTACGKRFTKCKATWNVPTTPGEQ